MNEIVKMIRKSGSVDLILEGETVTIGFQNSGMTGTLIMLGGGYYYVACPMPRGSAGRPGCPRRGFTAGPFTS
jgi:hypothetical protein